MTLYEMSNDRLTFAHAVKMLPARASNGICVVRESPSAVENLHRSQTPDTVSTQLHQQ